MLRPFSRFCVTIGAIPESIIKSLSYEQQLLRLIKFLKQTVIPAIDGNTASIKEIEDFLETLNLEEYVPEKIDEYINKMIEDGTLESMLKPYLDTYVQPQINALNTNFTNFTNSVTAEVDDFKDDVNESIENIENIVTAVASGSPAGTYSTVEALTSADPDHSKIYIVTGTGNWYYYDTSTSQWTSGGTYQSTEVGYNNIRYFNLNEELRNYLILETSSKLATNQLMTDKYVRGSVGATIEEVTSFPNRAYGVMNVTAGDIFYLSQYRDYSGSSLKYVILTDSSNKIIQTIDTIVNNNVIFMIPSGVTKLYFNLFSVQSTNTDSKYNYNRPLKITGYSYKDTRIEYSDNEIEIQPSEFNVNIAYNALSYWNYSVSGVGLRTYIFDVKPNTQIRLSTKIVNNLYQAGIFANNDLTSAIKIVGFTESSSSVDYDEVLTVPSLATKLICTVIGSATVPHVYQRTLSDVNSNNLTVNKDDSVLTITAKNGNYIKFANYGGNDLFMIKEYKIGTFIRQMGTDMTPAPYIVEAVNNANGDRGFSSYTGGNHQYNNQASGSTPTAEQESLYIYLDNTATNLAEDGTSTCNEVTIVETNLVQATNTCLQAGGGRNVLREKITFKYDGKELKVSNEITPLEEIVIKEYYGIQSYSANLTDFKVYADKVYTSNNYTSCPERPHAIIGEVKMQMFECGLGNYQYNNDSDMKARMDGHKAYYVPIAENTTHFTNEILYFEGSYTFDKNYLI